MTKMKMALVFGLLLLVVQSQASYAAPNTAICTLTRNVGGKYEAPVQLIKQPKSEDGDDSETYMAQIGDIEARAHASLNGHSKYYGMIYDAYITDKLKLVTVHVGSDEKGEVWFEYDQLKIHALDQFETQYILMCQNLK